MKNKGFKNMITPTIIKILYWISMIFSILVGIILLLMSSEFYVPAIGIILGLICIIIVPLIIRIKSELVMIMFEINYNIVNIHDTLKINSKNTSEIEN